MKCIITGQKTDGKMMTPAAHSAAKKIQKNNPGMTFKEAVKKLQVDFTEHIRKKAEEQERRKKLEEAGLVLPEDKPKQKLILPG
jgi:hypothetical protein